MSILNMPVPSVKTSKSNYKYCSLGNLTAFYELFMNDLDHTVHGILVIPLYHRKEWHYWIDRMPSGIRLARSLLVIGLIGALTRHRFMKVFVKGGNGFNRITYGS